MTPLKVCSKETKSLSKIQLSFRDVCCLHPAGRDFTRNPEIEPNPGFPLIPTS